MASRPWYSGVTGGIVDQASSVSNATTPSMSLVANAVRTGSRRTRPSPILAVKAFGEYQAGIMDRCDEPGPEAFTEIGSYRFLAG